MILQALNGYYERLANQPGSTIAPPGYSYQPISFAVVLSPDGSIADIDDLRTPDGKKFRPREMLVPQPPKRSGRNPPPCFLWDKTGYVFGVEPQKSDAESDEAAVLAQGASDVRFAENPAYHQAFKDYHRDLLGKCDDSSILALLRFLESWLPANYGSLRHASEMLGANVVFRVDGHRTYLHQSQDVQAIWGAALTTTESASGLCLVRGETQPIARLHNSIKGVQGAQSSGASIVSFNQSSFTSYGKEQGANAPVSEQAAFAYTTALNALLRRDSKQRVQIGDATTVFWAEADDREVAATVERVAGLMIDPPSEAERDSDANAALKTVMDCFHKGRPFDAPELKLDPATRFYILGLAPNAARLSVRYWEATTLGRLGKAYFQHWTDMRLETPPPRAMPPSIRACVLRTAPARTDRQDKIKFSFDDVSPLLAGELMRAVITGGRYPASLLANLVMRIRSDHHLDRVRVALIKACIVRAMRFENRLPQEDYLVRSDPDDPNDARRLGRLFAVLERAQSAALGDNVNATIKDKFIASAATTPAQVFVGLLKTSQHHTRRLCKGHSDAKWIKDPSQAKRIGFAIERDIGKLVSAFHGGLPAQHSVEEQGLFFVGYYQERFGGRPDPDVGTEPNIDTSGDIADNNDDIQE